MRSPSHTMAASPLRLAALAATATMLLLFLALRTRREGKASPVEESVSRTTGPPPHPVAAPVVGVESVSHDADNRRVTLQQTQSDHWYVLRVTGATRQNILFNQAGGGGQAVATYHTCEAGRYWVQVLRAETTCSTVENFLVQIEAFDFQVSGNNTTCGRRGWWADAQDTRTPYRVGAVLTASERKRLRFERVASPTAVAWDPSILPRTCFVGDSQMRNNINGLVDACDGEALQRTKSVCPGDLRYFEMHFLRDWERVPVNDCEVIVANFGQWDAGWPEGRITPVEEYGALVAALVAKATGARRRFVWMTNNPADTGENWRYFACPKTEWRDLRVMAAYNEAANRVMRAHGVPVWDTVGVLGDVFDRTFDHAHFSPWLTRNLREPLMEAWEATCPIEDRGPGHASAHCATSSYARLSGNFWPF